MCKTHKLPIKYRFKCQKREKEASIKKRNKQTSINSSILGARLKIVEVRNWDAVNVLYEHRSQFVSKSIST